MFSERNIIHINDFDFENGKKPPKGRFLIILLNNKNLSVVLSGITKRDRIPAKHKPISNPCIRKEDNVHGYLFPKNKIIGENGYKMKFNSYVYMGRNIMSKEIGYLENKYKNKITIKDKLCEVEYYNLIYCVYKSKYITKDVFRILEEKLENYYN